MALGKTTVCFDVDGTLIDYEDNPREEVITLLKAMADSEFFDVYVWSGGGVPYAEMWGRRLNLPENVQYVRKTSFRPDIAVDDEDEFLLANTVIHVGLPLESS